VAPKYAGIVMGVSNTAGTVAGIVGVWLTGLILETSQKESQDLTRFEGWKMVFLVQGFLCIFSSVVYLAFSTGERIFE
jgi:MFS transporter, ACS family, solute carrier family 17 (sodium-dependent inorganic phosphate cotransporter), other